MLLARRVWDALEKRTAEVPSISARKSGIDGNRGGRRQDVTKGDY